MVITLNGFCNIPTNNVNKLFTSLTFFKSDIRRGRSYSDGRGNVVVEGIRRSEDTSDQISHRNGRYINNVFVPDSAPGLFYLFYLSKLG
jgi:hypothetical protein